jgi:ABC-2 type transport system permease protein
MIRYAVAAALARRDFEINRSYRVAFVLDLFWGAIDVLFYYYFSKIVGIAPAADLGGAPSYFAFALAGMAISVVILSATSTISSKVREEQLTGTLEFICANPVRSSEFALGTAAYPFLYASVRVTVYLVLGVAFLGLAAGDVNWAGVALIVPLSAFAMLGIGVLAAAATVVFKRGGSVVTVAVFGMTFISGALFPIELLPNWLQPIGQAMPTASALDGLREALYGGGGVWSEALILAGWAVILLPLSLWVFATAVNKARAQGALAQY